MSQIAELSEGQDMGQYEPYASTRVSVLKPAEDQYRKYDRLVGHTFVDNLKTLIGVYPRLDRFLTFSVPEQDAFVSCLAVANISERRLARMYAGKLTIPREEHAYNSKRGYLLKDYAVNFVRQFYPDFIFIGKLQDPKNHEEALRLAFLHIVKPLNIDQREELVEMLYEMRRHRTPEYVRNIFHGLTDEVHSEISIHEIEQSEPQ